MILQETPDWIAFNKPSGWHSVASGTSSEPSIEAWIQENRPDLASLPESGLIHRLDQPTSGCLLAAKTLKSHAQLKTLMQSRSVQKIYWAMVEGSASPGELSLYFYSRYKRSKKISVRKSGSPKELGECRWKILSAFEGSSLLEVQLIGGGKRHQIRASLASIGHPIRGDSLYGAKPWGDSFGLHARSLRWAEHEVVAPPPAEWQLRLEGDSRIL